MQRFSSYFNSWLYEDDAYYTKYKKIGKDGDFFTSVSTSSFFGGSIAKRIIKSIEEKKLPSNTTILEIGAHHGYLLADVIQFIYTLKPSLLKSLNFAIVEKYEDLRLKQKNYLQECFANEINFKHYEDISKVKLKSAFVFANEIFDCFACDLVYTNKQNHLELAKVKNHEISFFKCLDEDILEHCKKYNITKGEIALSYKNFVDTLCKNITNFEFLSFDYGDKYPRNDFSSRIYKNHQVYSLFEDDLDLKSLYKKSDITYDVHFDFLIDLFKQNGISNINFSTQGKTLIDFGILELLEILKANVSENTYLKETQKVKILLEPTGMGDRFKSLYIKK